MTNKRIAPKILLCGPEGCGKTYMGIRIARKAKRLITFDLNDQPEMSEGCVVAHSGSELLGYFKNADGRKKLHVCFRPTGGSARDAFEFMCGVAVRYRNVTLFADEAESLISARKDLPMAVMAVMKRGRHVQVPVVLTSQRPQDLHPQIRSNCGQVALFKSFDGTYANYIKTNYQMPDDKRNILSALNALDKYGYILVENGQPWKIMKKYQKT